MDDRQFYAKILLFGEYTVLLGSDALAIPLHHFSGNFAFGNTEKAYPDGVLKLFRHVAANPELNSFFLLDQWQQDLDDGMYFPSSIPQGYGLGSSGALVAAAYGKYAISHTDDVLALKTILSSMENAFHGASSGLDPLVSYLDKPLLFQHNGPILPILQPMDELDKFWLLDTGIARSTSEYVRLFQSKIDRDSTFSEQVDALKHKNQEAISMLVHQKAESVGDLFFQMSELQLSVFQEFIPAELLPVWENGLESRDYCLKLCGAGGGGMMLVYVPDDESLRPLQKKFSMHAIKRY